MVTVKETNLEMLRLVAERLSPLRDQLVFLGGCTTALFLTDAGAPDVRATRDVDLIVEVLSHADYWKLEEQLRQLGCTQELDEELTCRWQLEGLTVDVMPTDEKILGFANRWYSAAIHNSQDVEIAEQQSIRLVTPVYFLATKLEAFFGRGKDDYWGSHDLEDVITVIDGRPEIMAELSVADPELKNYIGGVFTDFLRADHFREALSGHLPPDGASQARLPVLWQRLKTIADLI